MEKSWRSSFLALSTSLALQGMALFFLGVTPLLTYEGLPMPQSVMPRKDYVPVMPGPPPALRKRPPQAKSPDSSRLLSRLRAQEMVFDELGAEDLEAFEASSEDPPHGIDGGMPGIPVAPPAVERHEGPAPAQPVMVGGDVRPPQKRRHVNPAYPPIAAQARIQGTVDLEATIDEQGNVTNLRVLRSIPLLDAAALEAVRQWKYEPTLLNGRPVPILMSVSVTFELGR